MVAEDRNVWTLARLELGSAKRVLEIGFGSGRALRAVLEQHPGLDVYGVDRSAVAVRRAEAWRSELPSAARLHLCQTALEDISPALGLFDRIFAVNVNAYWLRPDAAFPPTLACLAPGGLFLAAFDPPSASRGEEIAAALRAGAPDLAGLSFTVERDAVAGIVAVRARRAMS